MLVHAFEIKPEWTRVARARSRIRPREVVRKNATEDFAHRSHLGTLQDRNGCFQESIDRGFGFEPREYPTCCAACTVVSNNLFQGDCKQAGIDRRPMVLHDSDLHVRRAAAELLGRLGDAASMEPLMKGLRGNSAGHGSSSFDRLCHVGDRSTRKSGVFLKSDSLRQRQAALVVLSQLKSWRHLMASWNRFGSKGRRTSIRGS